MAYVFVKNPVVTGAKHFVVATIGRDERRTVEVTLQQAVACAAQLKTVAATLTLAPTRQTRPAILDRPKEPALTLLKAIADAAPLLAPTLIAGGTCLAATIEAAIGSQQIAVDAAQLLGSVTDLAPIERRTTDSVVTPCQSVAVAGE